MDSRALATSTLAVALLAAGGPATAMTSTDISVRRCTAPDGTLIFTDKSCASLGATERRGSPTRDLRGRMRPASSYGSGTGPECARSPGALVASLSSAAQANDVNRVAALVDWSGAGSGAAHRLLRKLNNTMKAAPVEVSLQDSSVGRTYDAHGDIAPAPVHAPTVVRVDQFRSDGGGESLLFAVRNDLGCYWLGSSPTIERREPDAFAGLAVEDE